MTTSIPRLKQDNGAMPVLGLGTWQNDGVMGRRSVREAVELGYRHLDTAQMYDNEDVVGPAVRESEVDRDSVFITTKIARDKMRPADVRDSVDGSLQRLATEYVDLLLIHWPDDSIPLEETLGAMAELRDAGKVKHIGVSNFPVSWMEKAVEVADAPLFCNQVEYHPYLEQDPVLDFCRNHDIAVVAYSPLAQGAVTKDDRLTEIGKRQGKTAAQVALRWLIQQPGVAAIPKGTSVDHVRENLDIFDFELSEEDVERIDAIEDTRRVIDPPWAPKWDT